MNKSSLIYRLCIIVAIVVASLLVGLHREVFQAARLERELSRLGGWAAVLFVLLYAVATVLFVPGSAFSLAGGAMFGPVWDTIWNLAGGNLGAGLAFLTARYLAADWVAKKGAESLNRILRGVEADGWRFVAFVRLVPLFPFNLLNYALGLTRIAFRVYLLTSAICMVPGVLAYTWLGHAGRQAVAGRQGIIRDLLIAIGIFVAVGMLPRLRRRFREDSPWADPGGDIKAACNKR